MGRVDAQFAERVYGVVAEIPYGRVATYGQIAALCGHAYAAWEVGQIAHRGPAHLPWHRVVNKQGGMASAYIPGGPAEQQRLLETEGIPFTPDQKIKDLNNMLWQPDR